MADRKAIKHKVLSYGGKGAWHLVKDLHLFILTIHNIDHEKSLFVFDKFTQGALSLKDRYQLPPRKAMECILKIFPRDEDYQGWYPSATDGKIVVIKKVS